MAWYFKLTKLGHKLAKYQIVNLLESFHKILYLEKIMCYMNRDIFWHCWFVNFNNGIVFRKYKFKASQLFLKTHQKNQQGHLSNIFPEHLFPSKRKELMWLYLKSFALTSHGIPWKNLHPRRNRTRNSSKIS